MSNYLSQFIEDHMDFPKKGILFKDILPVLQQPDVFSKLINKMSSSEIVEDSDALVAIDARGFIFGSAISIQKSKPLILARKPGKLPGNLLTKSYSLEYGENELSIQNKAIQDFQTFTIIDDLLATGGTAKCVSEILRDAKKTILGLSVVIELSDINGKLELDFPVISQLVL